MIKFRCKSHQFFCYGNFQRGCILMRKTIYITCMLLEFRTNNFLGQVITLVSVLANAVKETSQEINVLNPEVGANTNFDVKIASRSVFDYLFSFLKFPFRLPQRQKAAVTTPQTGYLFVTKYWDIIYQFGMNFFNPSFSLEPRYTAYSTHGFAIFLYSKKVNYC